MWSHCGPTQRDHTQDNTLDVERCKRGHRGLASLGISGKTGGRAIGQNVSSNQLTRLLSLQERVHLQERIQNRIDTSL